MAYNAVNNPVVIETEKLWRLQDKFYLVALSVGPNDSEQLKVQQPFNISVDIAHFNQNSPVGSNLLLVATPHNFHHPQNYLQEYGGGLGSRFVPNISVQLQQPVTGNRHVYLINGPDLERVLTTLPHRRLETPLSEMRPRATAEADTSYKAWTLLDLDRQGQVAATTNSRIYHYAMGSRSKRNEEVVKVIEADAYNAVRRLQRVVEFSMAWMPTAKSTVDNIVQTQWAVSRFRRNHLFYIWLVTREPITFYSHRIFDNVRIVSVPINGVDFNGQIAQHCVELVQGQPRGFNENLNMLGGHLVEHYFPLKRVRSHGHVFWMDVMEKTRDPTPQNATYVQPAEVADVAMYCGHDMFGPGPLARPLYLFKVDEIANASIAPMWNANKIFQIEFPVKNSTETSFFCDGHENRQRQPSVMTASYFVKLPRPHRVDARRQLYMYDFAGFDNALRATPILGEKYATDVDNSAINAMRLRAARTAEENEGKTVWPFAGNEEPQDTATERYVRVEQETLHFFFFLEPLRPTAPEQEVFIGVKNLPPNVRAYGVSRHMMPDFFYDSLVCCKIPYFNDNFDEISQQNQLLRIGREIFEIHSTLVTSATGQVRNVRYFLAVINANMMARVATASFANMPLPGETFELLVIRCNHHLLPQGQEDNHPWLINSIHSGFVHVFEMDSRHFVEENRRIGALFPAQDGAPGYKYLGAMHWWRTNGVPLFDTNLGYPVDTTYKADSYFRSFWDEPNKKTSRAAANDPEQLRIKSLRADARIFSEKRLEYLNIAKQNYLTLFEEEYAPISLERLEARRALHPVNAFTEAWRLTHGCACDCEACLDLLNRLPNAARQAILEQAVVYEGLNRAARLHYMANLEYSPKSITQLRYKTYIEALELGIRDINLTVVRKYRNLLEMRARGILSDYYMLNRPEREVMMKQRPPMCTRCYSPECPGAIAPFDHSNFLSCPYCGYYAMQGWNCEYLPCISRQFPYEIHSPFEPLKQ